MFYVFERTFSERFSFEYRKKNDLVYKKEIELLTRITVNGTPSQYLQLFTIPQRPYVAEGHK